jgi:hypothetical protein
LSAHSPNKTVATEKAFATGNRERHNHTIADLELCVLGANFNDLSHVLVAKNVSLFHRWNDAAVYVKVGATNRASSDFDNRVTRMLNFRVRNFLASNFPLAMPRQCFHAELLLFVSVEATHALHIGSTAL